jgi:hypothetical protein
MNQKEMDPTFVVCTKRWRRRSPNECQVQKSILSAMYLLQMLLLPVSRCCNPRHEAFCSTLCFMYPYHLEMAQVCDNDILFLGKIHSQDRIQHNSFLSNLLNIRYPNILCDFIAIIHHAAIPVKITGVCWKEINQGSLRDSC